jgi:hypothetical protein
MQGAKLCSLSAIFPFIDLVWCQHTCVDTFRKLKKALAFQINNIDGVIT